MSGWRGNGVEENRRNEENSQLNSTRHICVVTETYPPEVNGVALTLGHLVKGLRQRGHHVSIIRPHQANAVVDAHDPDVTEVSGLPLPRYKGLQFGLPAGGLLRRLWISRRPNVVYVATEGPLGWSAVSIARQLAIPVFSGFHTNFHSYSRHYGIGFLGNLVLLYLRAFHNRTKGTLVPSPDLRDHLGALGFSNVGYMGRGVDSDLFTPARRSGDLRRQWGVRGNELVVAYIGRLASEKNLSLAIEAFRAMKRVASSARFVLVGDGPLRRLLQAEHDDFIFCGLQTGERLAAHYASADIFVFPSETETFGNVVLEAMASGLALIAYDYAAAKSHITNGETGVLVPLGDSRAFVAAAAEMIRALPALEQMRIQARRYSTSISWSGVVERFEALLGGEPEPHQKAIKPLVGRQNLATAVRGRM
jgi:glycosyltransferase involved in cell wall biosynthesis